MAVGDKSRYYAEEVELEADADLRGQLQRTLDLGERKDWHLMGVSSLPNDNVILFWDTTRPNYARSQYES
ncbi:hypothetical protein [Rubrobacter aplysinae]|uniref:hypothetical protein n=1 Tax=Rubrobacter aplysinae TaxID=909625 RepID=UPI00128D3D1C|nr:hypothetical protein [Rubrobacter aplysinae]